MNRKVLLAFSMLFIFLAFTLSGCEFFNEAKEELQDPDSKTQKGAEWVEGAAKAGQQIVNAIPIPYKTEISWGLGILGWMATFVQSFRKKKSDTALVEVVKGGEDFRGDVNEKVNAAFKLSQGLAQSNETRKRVSAIKANLK